MQAEVILSPGEFERHDLQGKIAVVIDVFRFTTTVLTALEAGISGFYPLSEIEEAFEFKAKNPHMLLAGEQNALKVPGFDFGNSPLEHLGKNYTGERLICCTTNGTRAIQAARNAEKVVLASLRSAKAVAEYLNMQNQDVIILPAGLAGTYSLEDTWCAGLILDYLDPLELSDGALAAKLIYGHTSLSDVANSAHGQRLQALDMQADLEFCLQINRSNGVITWDAKTGWGELLKESE